MTRSLQPLGTAKFMLAMLTPWRPAFRTRAANSGATFFVSARDVVGRHIAKYGGHEPGLTAWVDRYLGTQPRGIVVDVGANIGWHTVHAARCPTVETVVAFEPDAFNCWLLDRNIEANALDNVIVLKSAVGAEAGTARLHLYKASNNGRHSLLAGNGTRSRIVTVVDIDTSLSQLGLADRQVSLMKIDVEGYEPNVIAGARQTLARTRAVITEFSPHLDGGHNRSAWDMVADLHGAGFTATTLNDSQEAIPLNDQTCRSIKDQTDIIWLRAGKTALA